MPMLPSIEVTQTQADRMLAAYGSIANYKQWLTQSIIDYVLADEERKRREVFDADQTAKRKQGATELGGTA